MAALYEPSLLIKRVEALAKEIPRLGEGRL